jgi:tetratricopeptide (TPR) repeat protein
VVHADVAAEQDPFEQARLLYERAVFQDDVSALAEADQVLDAAEAALALARGRIMHARFLAASRARPQEQSARDPSTGGPDAAEQPSPQEPDTNERACFEHAAALFHRVGDVRGEAESLFWAGTFHQVISGDQTAAVPLLERARDLAAAAGDRLTLSYAVRHLGFADMEAGQMVSARENLEESVRLRREVGFMPGVAAGLLALAELAALEGNREGALMLLDEAATTAADAGAHGILHWIRQARDELPAD